MYNEIEVHERPLLLDRIQLSVTPNYIESLDINNSDEYKDLIIANRKLKDFKFKSFRHNKRLYYHVKLPDFEELQFVKDIKVSAFHPFTVSFKINFIRLLRNKIKDSWKFRRAYDEIILLDEDNYINYETWPYWDNNIVSELINELNDICIKIADKSMAKLLPYHEIEYKKVTVSQIETNIDFYVGCSNSIFAIGKFANFIDSNEGKELRRTIEEIAIKSRLPKNGITREPTKVEKNESYSVQFEIYKGIFFKVYRKTKEHIRAELTFKKDILRKKFKKRVLNYDGSIKVVTSRDIKRIVKPVIEWSKEFFKKADMTNVFYHILSHKENVIVINQLQPLHKFFRNSVPEMNTILDSILNGLPVRDKKAITFLRRNPVYRKDFIREYDSNGNYYYDYNPVESERRRINDVINKHARPKITKAIEPGIPRYIVWRGDKIIFKE